MLYTGVEYISFYLIAQNIMLFTWAEHIVKQQYEGDEAKEELEAGEPQTQVSWAGKEDQWVWVWEKESDIRKRCIILPFRL